MKRLIIDPSLCNGCYCCQIACKDEHCDNDWTPYAAKQPEIGQYWIGLEEDLRGSIPFVRITYTPKMCHHCADCPLIELAPEAVYRRDDGLVIIDPTKAVGRKDLVDACPYHAVFWNEGSDIAQKCTGCAHLLDNGWEVPRCVDACPTFALRYIEDEMFESEIPNVNIDSSLSDRVVYINTPKRFIAGTVVDLGADEVLIGAGIDLIGVDGNVVCTATTDDFGDFIFEDVEAGKYKVSVPNKSGGKEELVADATDVDVNLGVFDYSAA